MTLWMVRPWGRIYVDCKDENLNITAFLLTQYGIGLHTSIANVGVSEPGRESKTGVYGSDMVY
jgi:hypothetical protein